MEITGIGTVENALKSGSSLKPTLRNRRFIMHNIKKNPRLTPRKKNIPPPSGTNI